MVYPTCRTAETPRYTQQLANGYGRIAAKGRAAPVVAKLIVVTD